ALPGMAAFYAWWYPTRWLGWSFWPRFAAFGPLAGELRFVERAARRLARQSFHGMLAYQAKLQNKQAFLFRLVDIANELFAMAASIARARALADAGRPESREARDLTLQFCRSARRRIRSLFRDLWSNDDDLRYRSAQEVLAGRHAWLEAGILSAPTRETAKMKVPESAPERAGVA
ncbi:MAG: acyl-CoA dehydrogenase, partial [Vicinamibacteria bacterium]